MLFLLRMAFWLGIVLVLLPTGKTSDADKGPQIGTSEAVTAASAAVSDMAQFCKRQPTACDVGGQAATVITQRAQAGARKVYEFITEKTEKTEKSDKAEKIDTSDKVAKVEKAEKVDKIEKAVKPDKKSGKTKEAKKSPDHTGSIEHADDGSEASAKSDELTDADLQLEWQMPSP
jgi:hypothetical protein